MIKWNQCFPKEGTPVMVRVNDDNGMEFPAQWVAVEESDGHDVYGWVAITPKHPACWSDGRQWRENESGETSASVTHWRHLASWEISKIRG